MWNESRCGRPPCIKRSSLAVTYPAAGACACLLLWAAQLFSTLLHTDRRIKLFSACILIAQSIRCPFYETAALLYLHYTREELQFLFCSPAAHFLRCEATSFYCLACRCFTDCGGGAAKYNARFPVVTQSGYDFPASACEYTSIVYAFCRGASFSIGVLRRAGCTPALFAQPVCM